MTDEIETHVVIQEDQLRYHCIALANVLPPDPSVGDRGAFEDVCLYLNRVRVVFDEDDRVVKSGERRGQRGYEYPVKTEVYPQLPTSVANRIAQRLLVEHRSEIEDALETALEKQREEQTV